MLCATTMHCSLKALTSHMFPQGLNCVHNCTVTAAPCVSLPRCLAAAAFPSSFWCLQSHEHVFVLHYHNCDILFNLLMAPYECVYKNAGLDNWSDRFCSVFLFVFVFPRFSRASRDRSCSVARLPPSQRRACALYSRPAYRLYFICSELALM